MPRIFKDLYPRARCIIDCSEIFIERPASYLARAQTYSNYKRHNSVKFLIGISSYGAITSLSKCWRGRASDKCITLNSGFLNLIEHVHVYVILADGGFDISDDLGIYGVKLVIQQLSISEVEYSKRISKVHIHVERMIGLLKNKYAILQFTLPVSNVKHKHDTDFFTACSALLNLCPSVVPY